MFTCGTSRGPSHDEDMIFKYVYYMFWKKHDAYVHSMIHVLKIYILHLHAHIYEIMFMHRYELWYMFTWYDRLHDMCLQNVIWIMIYTHMLYSDMLCSLCDMIYYVLFSLMLGYEMLWFLHDKICSMLWFSMLCYAMLWFLHVMLCYVFFGFMGRQGSH